MNDEQTARNVAMNLTELLFLLKKARKLRAMKPLSLQEQAELTEYNRVVLGCLCDAEKTRTSECIHERNWRDDVSVTEALEMAQQIEKYRNKG